MKRRKKEMEDDGNNGSMELDESIKINGERRTQKFEEKRRADLQGIKIPEFDVALSAGDELGTISRKGN